VFNMWELRECIIYRACLLLSLLSDLFLEMHESSMADEIVTSCTGFRQRKGFESIRMQKMLRTILRYIQSGNLVTTSFTCKKLVIPVDLLNSDTDSDDVV
jgi:hypothetical protein